MFKVFDKNYLKKANKELEKINKIEDYYKSMTDEELREKTNELRSKLKSGVDKKEILPEAFALVRESCDRVLGKRPYDVQMIGGIILDEGQIAEMKTGEGKANPVDLKIPTPDGWKTCGDIAVGDLLFDKYGEPTEVLGVYPQGSKMQFEVTLSDGRMIPCANNHLWTVYDECDNFLEPHTLSTKDLVSGDKLKNKRYWIELPEAVKYNENKLKKSGEEIIYNFFETLKNNNELTVERIQRQTEEERAEALHKCVKEEYLISDVEERWEMFETLVELYEFKNIKGGKEIIVPTNDQKVVDFIKELIYSLGLSVICRIEDKNSIFTINFDINGVKECRLINIVSIEKNRSIKKEMVCFEVKNEEHLFLVGDFVVTHNTIVSAAPIYLNALQGKVHVITVNDYLAKRDEKEIGKVLEFLGVKSSVIYPNMSKAEKQLAYKADVIYGTNKEFGFDYLRDNMAKNKEDLLQTGLDFAIVDEADSVLIDDARTPLIISGQGEGSSDLYKLADVCVRQLKKGEAPPELTQIESASKLMDGNNFSDEEIEKMKDYVVYEKDNMVVLTDRGVKKVEKILGLENLGDESNIEISHHIHQALIAYGTMKKDENYIIKDGKVQIVDDFTGRVLDGRRYSDGLHQAIEAKEDVEIQEENKTLATISLQNYFRQYKKIAGMTGTAKTEEVEFKETYNMNVVVIPTNLPVIREDKQDLIYITEKEKMLAVIEDIKKHHSTGQPILVGTPTIEQSEKLSTILKEEGLKHNLLNAKNNELEADIVAQAGVKDAITIATNMAGRGTDIMLGGNPEFLAIDALRKKGLSEEEIYIATNFINANTEEEQALKDEYKNILNKKKEDCKKAYAEVKSLGGLHVIGTAKHEARRIDNQLRGRSGRQGDPGSSQFFLSLDDDIIRVFSNGMLKSAAKKLGLKYGEPINNKQLINMVETSQKRLELKNYDIRKNTLEYDDVDNIERQIIYKKRSDLVNNNINISSEINDYIKFSSNSIVEECMELSKENNTKDKTYKIINNGLKNLIGVEDIVNENMSKKEMAQSIEKTLKEKYIVKIDEIEKQKNNSENIQNNIALSVIDAHWIQYITAVQNLRDLTSLTGYGNTKPVDIYKQKSLDMFNDLLLRIKTDIVFSILNYEVPQNNIINCGTVEIKL